MNAGPELVAALDFPEKTPALRVARALRRHVSWVKVGQELFCAEGPRVIHELREMHFKVFRDLKFHDIPNTVYGAVSAACRLGANMLTLHLTGGERMARAAVEAAHKHAPGPLVFGVTILTGIGPGEFFASKAQTLRGLAALAGKLALSARDWGLDGVVCSGCEARGIKRLSGLACLTPGIRPRPEALCADAAHTPHDDQRRVVTPAEAIRAGADYLVVGRPITEAPDPLQAALRILEDMRRPLAKTTGRSPADKERT